MQRILKALIAAVLFLSILGGGLATAEEYRLGPGDVLSISVWGMSDLTVNTQVSSLTQVAKPEGTESGIMIRPDGKISFPLVGEVTAAGLTTSQFTDLITKVLREYVNEPKVTVNVVKFRTTRVYALGEVVRPGMYELDKNHNLLDAIGIAGGYTQYAAKKLVFVLRNGKTEQPLKINLLRLLKEGDMSQNVPLGEGDVVYITSSGKLDFARDILPFIYGAYYIGQTKN